MHRTEVVGCTCVHTIELTQERAQRKRPISVPKDSVGSARPAGLESPDPGSFGKLTNFKSKKEIQFELRSKGISNEVIKNVLDGFEIDEEQIVKDLIKQKKYKWEKYEKKVREQKMKEYLMRKGFGWNIISKMVQ